MIKLKKKQAHSERIPKEKFWNFYGYLDKLFINDLIHFYRVVKMYMCVGLTLQSDIFVRYYQGVSLVLSDIKRIVSNFIRKRSHCFILIYGLNFNNNVMLYFKWPLLQFLTVPKILSFDFILFCQRKKKQLGRIFSKQTNAKTNTRTNSKWTILKLRRQRK